MRAELRVPLAFAGLLALTSGTLGAVITAKLTAASSGRFYGVDVHGCDVGPDGEWRVRLAASPQTRSAGSYGLFLPGGEHVSLGDDVEDLGTAVTRRISAEDAAKLIGVRRASWSGIRFPTPESAGFNAIELELDAPAGPIPAWRSVSSDTSTDWALHVHGMGSSRAACLRGVRVAQQLGLTSLVVTYRNTSEGPRVGSGRSTLGMSESLDVAAALSYIVAHGGRRVVLFGWSMGANIALRLAHAPEHQGLITAVVADSPVLDWRATLAANCRRAHLPGWCAKTAEPWLGLRPLAKALGLPDRVDLAQMDWTDPGRVSVPMLILQGTHDTSTPWSTASELARMSDAVDLALFEAEHTTSWNSDPERWERVVSAWVERSLSHSETRSSS